VSEVHPEIRRFLLEAYLRPQCPTAASCIRITLLWAAAQPHPVPTHSALKRLLTKFRLENPNVVLEARCPNDAWRSLGRRGRAA
jgi:hypothetical protein